MARKQPSPCAVSEPLLSRLSEVVSDRMGLHFPPERQADLAKAMSAACLQLDFETPESLTHALVSSPWTKEQVETLANYLTVGESYFFRDKKTLEILEQEIFPELIRSRRGVDQRLRIWSAGCCRGEEPYTIAILLHRLIPDLQDWRITIVATDINSRFLKTAAQGAFSEWSFRETPAQIKERYFKEEGLGRFQILPQIQSMVKFSDLNLAEDAYPSPLNDTNALDLILCRNVMMYFLPQQINQVIERFHRCLTDGGWLAVSPSETSSARFSRFVAVGFPGVFLYQKDSAQPQRVKTFQVEPGITSDVSIQWPPPSLASQGPPTPSAETTEASFPLPDTTPALEESQPAVYLEALELYQQARYAEVVNKLLEWITNHQPERQGKGPSGEACALLARAYANQGQLAEAREWCQKAIAAEKLNPAFYYLCATILQEQGQVDHAINLLRQALYLDPAFVLAHFALANLSLLQRRLGEFGKHRRNALSLLRSHPPDAVLPEAEGITAGKLVEITASMTERMKPA